MYWRDDIPKLTLTDDAKRQTKLTLVAGTYGGTKAQEASSVFLGLRTHKRFGNLDLQNGC